MEQWYRGWCWTNTVSQSRNIAVTMKRKMLPHHYLDEPVYRPCIVLHQVCDLRKWRVSSEVFASNFRCNARDRFCVMCWPRLKGDHSGDNIEGRGHVHIISIVASLRWWTHLLIVGTWYMSHSAMHPRMKCHLWVLWRTDCWRWVHFNTNNHKQLLTILYANHWT